MTDNRLPLLLEAVANSLVALQDAKQFFIHKGIITNEEYNAAGVTNINSTRQTKKAYDELTWQAFLTSFGEQNIGSYCKVSKHITDTINKLVECVQAFDEIKPYVKEILEQRKALSVSSSKK